MTSAAAVTGRSSRTTATDARGDGRRTDASGGETGSGLGERRVFRAAVVVAVVPFLVTAIAVIVAVGGDYRPTGDLAMTEMHIRDVGRHEVLTGLWSRYSWNHPGPMQFYVAAPFYWLTGGSSIGMVVGALAVNLASLVGILAIARRRGGAPLVLCSLAGCLLLTRTLGPEFLGDSWNLTLTVLPFALLAFLTWSMIAGETWALPVGAVVTTFLVQTHISFLATATPLLLWGALSVLLAARGDRDGAGYRHLVRPVGVTIGVLAALWLPPVIDVVINTPNNAGDTYRYFRDPGDAGHSIAQGWRVATGQFSLPPEWLTGKLPSVFGQSPFYDSSPPPVLLVPVVAAAVVLWRRPRDARGLVVTLGLMLTLVVVSIMRTAGPVQDYRLRYTWAPPFVAAVAVLWAAWLVATRRWPPLGRALVPAGLAISVLLAGVNTFSGVRAGTPHEDDVEVIETLAGPVLDAYGDVEGQVVVTEDVGIAGPWYSRALVLQLERAGVDVAVDPNIGFAFSPGRVHASSDDEVAVRLLVATMDDVQPLLDDPDVSLVSRWTSLPTDEYERLAGERRTLLADHEAGLVTDVELVDQLAPLDESLGGDTPDTTASDVAVFVNERPR